MTALVTSTVDAANAGRVGRGGGGSPSCPYDVTLSGMPAEVRFARNVAQAAFIVASTVASTLPSDIADSAIHGMNTRPVWRRPRWLVFSVTTAAEAGLPVPVPTPVQAGFTNACSIDGVIPSSLVTTTLCTARLEVTPAKIPTAAAPSRAVAT